MANAVVDNTVQLYSTRINFQDRFFLIKPKFCSPDELKRQFPCGLCKDILIQPHQTVCGQRTCKTCIDERFGDTDVIPCPMSHDDFDEDELAEEQCQRDGLHCGRVVHDPGVHRRMLNYRCFCINQPFGCCATPKWRKLKEHQNNCMFVPSPCANVGCNERFAEQNMSEHRQRCTFASSGDQGNVQETPSASPRCDTCLKVFDDPDELRIHQRVRPQCIKEGGKCHYCDFNASSVVDLKTHMEEGSVIHAEMQAIREHHFKRKINTLEKHVGELLLKKRRTDEMERLEALNKQKEEDLEALNLRGRVVIQPSLPSPRQQAPARNGELSWRLPGYKKKRADAAEGKQISWLSPAFYTPDGYRMCSKAYPNGDGPSAEGKYLSVYFVLMRGEHDDNLEFPFNRHITLELFNEHTGKSKRVSFQADKTSSSFKRPETEMNIATGCPHFALLSDIESTYLHADSICIKVKVRPGTDDTPP